MVKIRICNPARVAEKGGWLWVANSFVLGVLGKKKNILIKKLGDLDASADRIQGIEMGNVNKAAFSFFSSARVNSRPETKGMQRGRCFNGRLFAPRGGKKEEDDESFHNSASSFAQRGRKITQGISSLSQQQKGREGEGASLPVYSARLAKKRGGEDRCLQPPP